MTYSFLVQQFHLRPFKLTNLAWSSTAPFHLKSAFVEIVLAYLPANETKDVCVFPQDAAGEVRSGG